MNNAHCQQVGVLLVLQRRAVEGEGVQPGVHDGRHRQGAGPALGRRRPLAQGQVRRAQRAGQGALRPGQCLDARFPLPT